MLRAGGGIGGHTKTYLKDDDRIISLGVRFYPYLKHVLFRRRLPVA